MPKAVLKFTGTQPTMDATLEFNIPRFPEIKDNLSNIIFLDMNGRKLPHWIEHDENMKPTDTVYVKVPFIDENGTSIVMYWDQGIDKGLGNIDETFLIGDDFELDYLDNIKWVTPPTLQSGSEAQVAGSTFTTLKLNNTSGGWGIEGNFALQDKLAIKSRIYLENIYWDMLPRVRNSSYHWDIATDSSGTALQIYYYNGSKVYLDGTTTAIGWLFTKMIMLENYSGFSAYVCNETKSILIQASADYTLDPNLKMIFGSGGGSDTRYIVFDWIITYPYLSPTPQLSHASLEHSLALWAIFAEGVVKFFFGSNVFVAYLKQLLNSSEIDVSKSSSKKESIDNAIVSQSTDKHTENIFVPYIIQTKPTGFINISKQFWEDYISSDRIAFINLLLNNSIHIVSTSAFDRLPGEISVGDKTIKLPAEHISISYEQFIKFIENIFDAVELKTKLLDQITSTTISKSSYQSTIQITELLGGLLAGVKEVVAQLIGRTQAPEYIVIPNQTSYKASSKEVSAYAVIFNTSEQIASALKELLEYPSHETIAMLEELKHRLNEQISILFKENKITEERVAKPSESKQLSELIDTAQQLSKELSALVRNTEMAIDSISEELQTSKDAYEILTTEIKSGKPFKTALSSIEKLRKFVITITRTLVEKVIPHD